MIRAAMAKYKRYLFIIFRICSSYFSQTKATRKNLANLPIKETIIKSNKLKFRTPAVIVNILYGTGVNAAIKRKNMPYFSKEDFADKY